MLSPEQVENEARHLAATWVTYHDGTIDSAANGGAIELAVIFIREAQERAWRQAPKR